MTIAATTRKAGPFTGTGSVYQFEFSFKVFARSEVVVTVSSNDVETVLELDTDYSVSLNEDQDVNPGGTVTLDEALPEGDKLAITSAVPYSQEIALTNKGGFYPTILNEALDKLTAQCQQLQEQNTRTVTVPATSSISPSEYLNEIFDARETAIEKASAAAASASSASTSATKAQTWAEGNDSAVSALGGTHSAKGWVNLMSPHFAAIEGVYADAANVDAVAGSIANVNAVGVDIASVNAVAGDLTNIDAVNANKTNINTVAGSITSVVAVGADIASVNSVAGDLTNIDAVNANKTNIDAVAGNATNINAVNANKTNIDAVAGSLANVNTVAADIADVSAVAGVAPDVSTVAGIASDVTAVAGNGTDVSAVADDITSVIAVAADLTNIDAASGYAADSKQWAIGEPTEPSGGSAKFWAGQAAAGQVNSNWTEDDPTSKAFILNKPFTDIDDKTIKNINGELEAVAVMNANGGGTALKSWSGTKAQYDALVSGGTVDTNTLYNITDDATISTSLLELLFPVGAIYVGVMQTCPLAALGVGTWTLVAQNRSLQGSGDNAAGTNVSAGLPNLTGDIDLNPDRNIFNAGQSGVFRRASTGGHHWSTIDGGSSDGLGSVTFDASRSNAIYGASNTVQPPAYVVNIWQRTA